MTDIEEFFDAEADRYDRAYDDPGTGGRTLRERLEATLELLGDGPGDILDVGMGAGRLCSELDRRGWTVSGVDLSKAMVEAARARLPHLDERLVVGSVSALPFADETFDAVVATGVLEYVVDDLPGATSALARVLRAGGRAIVSFPNHTSPVHLWRGRILYPVVRTVKRVVPVGRTAPLRLPLSSVGALETALARVGLAVDDVRLVDTRGMTGRMAASRPRLSRRLATQIVFSAHKQDAR